MMFHRITRFFRLFPVLAGVLAAPAGTALAGPGSTIALPVESGGAFAVPVMSMKDLRFRSTIRQQYDFSCGSAALATLLTYHYNYPTSEQEIFREMYERGDKAKIKKEGFSLLDIKTYLEARGFHADGFVADVEQLAAARIPAIALVKEHGYHHFVVIKGLRQGRVLVGDPSAGTRAVPYPQFQDMWVNRILFVIRNKKELAKFDSDGDWRWVPRAPISDGVYRGTTDLALPKRGPSDF
ncbi:MAG TPA: C39 family peptidase [Rhodocyclaceae bacterium]|nr:C39 family peptidase [Rhodocyclaceae bacterium]